MTKTPLPFQDRVNSRFGRFVAVIVPGVAKSVFWVVQVCFLQMRNRYCLIHKDQTHLVTYAFVVQLIFSCLAAALPEYY